jgi:glycerate dehydrogenase
MLYIFEMKIVVTDGYALNPGDLSWTPIQELGDLEVYDRTSSPEVFERCMEAEIVLSNKTAFNKEDIDRLHNVKLISVLATGYNVIDVKAAKDKGIVVCNVPDYGTASVAQHTIALILELSNKISLHTASVAGGDWQQCADYSYSKKPLIELAGKTLGIIGLGNIGQQTAKIATALGMKVIYNSRHNKHIDLAEFKNLEDVFKEADFVSLHCPLTATNKEFVNKELLQLMKPTAYLINTARGQLINELDLADALNSNRIAGAALDVLSKEPPDNNNPLLKALNCVITPHNAWSTKEARQRILDTTLENIKAFINGHPKNVVNK